MITATNSSLRTLLGGPPSELLIAILMVGLTSFVGLGAPHQADGNATSLLDATSTALTEHQSVGTPFLHPSTDRGRGDSDRHPLYCARCYAKGTDEEPEHIISYNFPVIEGWHGNMEEEGANENGTHWNNLPGTCEDHHKRCKFDEHFTQKTVDAVIRGDIGPLTDLMESSHVYLVPGRSALQVLGCDRTVVAHVPIGPSLLSALEAVAADRDDV